MPFKVQCKKENELFNNGCIYIHNLYIMKRQGEKMLEIFVVYINFVYFCR